MRWAELETANCPVARSLSVIGDRWTVLMLRDALRGVTRFEEFHHRLGCSRAIVADRLAQLVEHQVLERQLYEAHPPRYDYRLTERGRALGPVLMMMTKWAEEWMPKPGARRIQRRHTACGHVFQPVIACSECGERVRPGEVEFLDPVASPKA